MTKTEPSPHVASAAAPSSPGGDEDDDVVCWCCLDATHESGQPLRRDCSCRGGSGFAHLPCIVDYADDRSWRNSNCHKQFTKPWRYCPSCHQLFQGELALDLANEFLAFVERRYPGYQWGNLVGLQQKLSVLFFVDERREDAKQTANTILSKIEQMKKDESPLLRALVGMEAYTCRRLGNLYLKDEKEESARPSIKYLERARDIYIAHESYVDVLMTDTCISRVKAKYYGGSHDKTREECRACYALCVQRLGEERLATIRIGICYYKTLRDARHGVDAERLLTRLVATSNRAHGSHHRVTKKAESELQLQRVRVVKIKSRNERFQVLHYNEDGTKCVVRGPISEQRNILEEKTLTVDTKDVHPALGTPIMCRGLKRSSHLNGKVGELRSFYEKTNCYEVHFEEADLEPRPIKKEFMHILFDLPEE